MGAGWSSRRTATFPTSSSFIGSPSSVGVTTMRSMSSRTNRGPPPASIAVMTPEILCVTAARSRSPCRLGLGFHQALALDPIRHDRQSDHVQWRRAGCPANRRLTQINPQHVALGVRSRRSSRTDRPAATAPPHAKPVTLMHRSGSDVARTTLRYHDFFSRSVMVASARIPIGRRERDDLRREPRRGGSPA